jgi:hypothetical protein
MGTNSSLKTFCGCVLLFAISPGRGSAQRAAAPQAAPAAQGAQAASICGGQAACYETDDFAVIMTDFRVSKTGGWKVIDTTLHFQNKTNQPLILGYTEGSAMAIDDQGNRYGLANQPNAVRGIGRVQGNSIDPKFSLGPAGSGDTMFELAWAPGQSTEGVNFELDLSIREIHALEGGQFSLAGEAPLQFRGLANGAFGGSTPGTAAGAAGGGLLATSGSTTTTAGALPVCGSGSSGLSSVTDKANSIAGQNLPANANSTVSNASTQMSNASAQIASLKSMFGHKKAATAQATPATASAAAPCVPAASATNATAVPQAVPAVAVSGSAAAPATATPAVATSSATTAVTAAPAGAQPMTPAEALRARVLANQAAAPKATATTAATPKTTVATTKPAAKKPASATTTTTTNPK